MSQGDISGLPPLPVLEKRKLSKVSDKPFSKKKRKKTPDSKIGVMNLRTPMMKKWKPTLYTKKLEQCSVDKLVGLDPSLTSPGCAVIHLKDRNIILYGFRHRVKDQSGCTLVTNPQSPFFEWSVQNVCLESKKEWEEGNRFQHYIEKLTKLVACIGPGTCKIGIEHYILPKTQKYGGGVNSGFLTLVELGGILRSLLWLKGHHDFIEMSASSIKLFFSGNGKANKQDMYQAYRKLWHGPDLYLTHGLKDESTYKHVPHPLEDEMDALAIALFTICYD